MDLCDYLDGLRTSDEQDLSWAKLYRFLMTWYHNVVHGGDYGRFMTLEHVFQHIRRPDEVRHVGSIAAFVTLEATRLSIRRFRPDQDEAMVVWYKARVLGRLPVPPL